MTKEMTIQDIERRAFELFPVEPENNGFREDGAEILIDTNWDKREEWIVEQLVINQNS